MQVADQVLRIRIVEQLEHQIELELQQIVLQVLQEVVVLMIDQLEERIVQMRLLDQLIVERLDQLQEVLEVQQHRVEALDQLDLIKVQVEALAEVLLQVEVLIEVAILQVEALQEVVLHQVEVLAEVALHQVEVLLAAEVAVLAEVLLEKTKKKMISSCFFRINYYLWLCK